MPIEIAVDEHPLLDAGWFAATFPKPLSESPPPEWLRALLSLEAEDLLPPEADEGGAISMPDADDPALEAKVSELRAAGEIVINCLATEPDPRCDRELVEEDGEWQVVPLD